MHKYEGIRRFEVTKTKEEEIVKSIERTEKIGGKVRSFLLRSLFAFLLVFALFLGKISGVSEIRKASESVKSAICYDFFDDVGEEESNET